MSARRRGRAKKGEAKRPPTRAPGKQGRGAGIRGVHPVAWLAASLVVVVAVVAWLAMRSERSAPVTRARTLPVEALLDSQRAAVAAEQWDRSVRWARRLAEAEPNDAMRTLGLGLAWHNWAWAGSPYDRARTATRTSLDRARMERRAFALLDSALTFARTHDDAARIHHWVGQIYEIYGLPVDALLGYQDALESDPSFELTLPRARWVMTRLLDPLVKDEAPAAPEPTP